MDGGKTPLMLVEPQNALITGTGVRVWDTPDQRRPLQASTRVVRDRGKRTPLSLPTCTRARIEPSRAQQQRFSARVEPGRPTTRRCAQDPTPVPRALALTQSLTPAVRTPPTQGDMGLAGFFKKHWNRLRGQDLADLGAPNPLDGPVIALDGGLVRYTDWRRHVRAMVGMGYRIVVSVPRLPHDQRGVAGPHGLAARITGKTGNTFHPAHAATPSEPQIVADSLKNRSVLKRLLEDPAASFQEPATRASAARSLLRRVGEIVASLAAWVFPAGEAAMAPPPVADIAVDAVTGFFEADTGFDCILSNGGRLLLHNGCGIATRFCGNATHVVQSAQASPLPENDCLPNPAQARVHGGVHRDACKVQGRVQAAHTLQPLVHLPDPKALQQPATAPSSLLSSAGQRPPRQVPACGQPEARRSARPARAHQPVGSNSPTVSADGSRPGNGRGLMANAPRTTCHTSPMPPLP